MFSLRNTLANRLANHCLPQGYNADMGILVLCGPRPTSIKCLQSSPCPQSVVVHFKSLLPINNTINEFINIQLIAIQELFAEGNIAVLPGTTEDLSNNPDLQFLQNMDVGTCRRGMPSKDIITLFGNRNNVGSNELIVYIVATITSTVPGVVGCATHPAGQPGVVVIRNNAVWLVAHEVGHVLGLNHISGQSDSLMYPSTSWTNVPPDVSNDEYSMMLNSDFTNPC